jgi:hypothetical protein
VKLHVKRNAEQERLTSKIEEMMNVKQRIAQEPQKGLAEKKHSNKIRKWEVIREDKKRKTSFEDRRIWLEEEKEENRVMMMYPTTMDALTKDRWKIRRAEILEAKKGGCYCCCVDRC